MRIGKNNSWPKAMATRIAHWNAHRPLEKAPKFPPSPHTAPQAPFPPCLHNPHPSSFRGCHSIYLHYHMVCVSDERVSERKKKRKERKGTCPLGDLLEASLEASWKRRWRCLGRVDAGWPTTPSTMLQRRLRTSAPATGRPVDCVRLSRLGRTCAVVRPRSS